MVSIAQIPPEAAQCRPSQLALTAIFFNPRVIYLFFPSEIGCLLLPGVSMSQNHLRFHKQRKTRKKQKRLLPEQTPYRYSAFWAETPVTQRVT